MKISAPFDQYQDSKCCKKPDSQDSLIHQDIYVFIVQADIFALTVIDHIRLWNVFFHKGKERIISRPPDRRSCPDFHAALPQSQPSVAHIFLQIRLSSYFLGRCYLLLCLLLSLLGRSLSLDLGLDLGLDLHIILRLDQRSRTHKDSGKNNRRRDTCQSSFPALLFPKDTENDPESRSCYHSYFRSSGITECYIEIIYKDNHAIRDLSPFFPFF